MKRLIVPVFSLALGIFVALQPVAGALQLTFEQQEEFLRTAKIIRERTLSQGVTNSKRVTMTNGVITHDAQVQTIDVFKQVFTGTFGTELNFKDTYKDNIAAYRLNRMLEIDMIPPSVERKVGGDSAAVTWWLDDVLMTEKQRFFKKIEPPDLDRWNRQMYIVRVFDQLIYNMDRNLGNLVITKGWHIWMIDHTRSFRLYKTLKDPRNLVRCDRHLLETMKRLDRDSLMRELRPYLTKGEIVGLLARRDRIVELFEEKIKLKGESAVLYDFLTTR